MTNKRIFEIDLLKILAIVLMIIFHLVYDLNEFAGVNIEYSSGPWHWVGRVAAFLFIFLAGINSGFSKHCVKRGLIVLGFGIAITIVTFIFFRDEYIKFGILHLLGICMIAFPYLKRLNNWFLLTSAIAVIYLYFSNTLDGTSFITFFNNIFGGPSLDYYPLFPYISLFIFGILAYKTLYYKRHSLLNLYTKNKIIYILSKYALFIYIIHQLIIVGLIFIVKFLAT